MNNMACNSWAYVILGLDQRSNPDANAIKTQFHKFILKFHPDKTQSSDKAKATARFQDILKAYNHLKRQHNACEEVIEEKVTADRWEIQPPRLKRRDREENGHFRQGDENKKKIEGRQARAMHRLSKKPRSSCSTVKRKARSQLERRQREEREQRATEKKQYASKSCNTTTRIMKAILENSDEDEDDPAIVDFDVYRNLNASSRRMRGAKPLGPEIWMAEKTIKDHCNCVFVMEEEEWWAVVLADIEKKARGEELFLPIKREPLTGYMVTEASREESKARRKSWAIPKKSKTLAGEDNADKEDLGVPEYVKRYIIEELVEDTADDETLERELACIGWGEDVDNWALDTAKPQGFKLEHILPTGFHLAHLPSGFKAEDQVALPIGFQVIDAPPRREWVMVDDNMVEV
jgi:hypothetical protein